jgi:predicted GTPase
MHKVIENKQAINNITRDKKTSDLELLKRNYYNIDTEGMFLFLIIRKF